MPKGATRVDLAYKFVPIPASCAMANQTKYISYGRPTGRRATPIPVCPTATARTYESRSSSTPTYGPKRDELTERFNLARQSRALRGREKSLPAVGCCPWHRTTPTSFVPQTPFR